MHQYSYPADDLPLMVDLTRRTVNCAEHHWWYWPPGGGGGGWKLVCGEPVQLHLTSMMVLAWIGKRGMVRTLVGECTASLSWPQGVCVCELVCGELVCGEPVQLHYINDASPDWEAGDGAHTRRGVHGILELTTGCVCVRVGLRWTSTVALNIDDGASPDWEAGDGAHTRRGVHGILELTMGWVGLPWTSDDSTSVVFTAHRKGMLARRVW